MPKRIIAEDIRLRIAQSMPVVERRRSAITEKMQERMQELEGPEETFGQAEVTALMLIELLVDGASDLAAFGGLRELSRTASNHRRLDVDGRHYSRFGLALAPVLREVLGIAMPPKTASAWCDAFWFIIAEMAPDETQESRHARSG
jgi:hemoglobin-like flavoprotein